MPSPSRPWQHPWPRQPLGRPHWEAGGEEREGQDPRGDPGEVPEELDDGAKERDVLLVGEGVAERPVVDHERPGQRDQRGGHGQRQDGQLEVGVDLLVRVQDLLHAVGVRVLDDK